MKAEQIDRPVGPRSLRAGVDTSVPNEITAKKLNDTGAPAAKLN